METDCSSRGEMSAFPPVIVNSLSLQRSRMLFKGHLKLGAALEPVCDKPAEKLHPPIATLVLLSPLLGTLSVLSN